MEVKGLSRSREQGARQAEITLRREVRKLAERDILKKAAAYFAASSLRYAFIAKHRGIWPLRWMGRMSRRVVFTVRPPSQRSRYDDAGRLPVLLRVVRATVSGGCGRMCWLGGMGAASSADGAPDASGTLQTPAPFAP